MDKDYFGFVSEGIEILRLYQDGSFYVKGKKVAKDIEVYNAFEEWSEKATKGEGRIKVDKDYFGFVSDGTEMLRFDQDGSFYVKGKKVAKDIEVYNAFKEWLEKTPKGIKVKDCKC